MVSTHRTQWSPVSSPARSHSASDEWAETLDRFAAGEDQAALRLARLVTGFLARWGAFDLRDEWPDLVQDALAALWCAVRERRLRRSETVVGYLRSIAHHKLADRLRAHRCKGPRDDLAWSISPEREPPCHGPPPELAADVRRAFGRLSLKERTVVRAVCCEGKTYEQAAWDSGVPLGTLKRCLRNGLRKLGRDLSASYSRPQCTDQRID